MRVDFNYSNRDELFCLPSTPSASSTSSNGDTSQLPIYYQLSPFHSLAARHGGHPKGISPSSLRDIFDIFATFDIFELAARKMGTHALGLPYFIVSKNPEKTVFLNGKCRTGSRFLVCWYYKSSRIPEFPSINSLKGVQSRVILRHSCPSPNSSRWSI